LTVGLLASNAAMVAALPATPRPQLSRRTTRLEEDLRLARALAARDEQSAANVDWAKLDYTGTDYSDVDWSSVHYDSDAASASISPMSQPTVSVSRTAAATQTPEPTSTAAERAARTSAAASASSSAYAPEPTNQAPMGTAPSQAPDYFAGLPASTNAISIVWHGDKAQTFNFYSDVAAFEPQFGDAFKSVTLQPGTYQTVALPAGFSGRVQKMTGRVDEPATWAEVTFNGYKDMTFFDASYIRGNNGAMVMKMRDNSAIAGTQEDLLSEAPDDAKGTSSSGQPYLKATEGFDGSVVLDLVAFYRNKLPSGLGYVRNFDDSATKGSLCKQIILSAW
jgi:hypothetical protein